MIEHLLCFAVGSGWGMVPEQWGSESLGCGWSSRVKRGWAAFDLETTILGHQRGSITGVKRVLQSLSLGSW